MLSLLKNWHKDGCILEGITKHYYQILSLNMSQTPRYRVCNNWSLGSPVTFFVQIYDFWGPGIGIGTSVAQVFIKESDEETRHIEDIYLYNPNDILGVVDALNKKFSGSDSEEAKIWREVMADLDKEKAEAETLPARYRQLDPIDSDQGTMPDYLEEIFDDWRFTYIGDDTPDELIEVFIRFGRSWYAWASTSGQMYGNAYTEQLKRWDEIGFIIDRKLHKTKDIDYQVKLMGIYRQLMPCYLGDLLENAKKEVEYERKWNKWIAEDIVKDSRPLSYGRASLLLRTREDNHRLPAVISKYIKTEIPRFIKETRQRIDIDEKEDITGSVKRRIHWLDLFLRWNTINKIPGSRSLSEVKEIIDSVARDIDKVEDPDILYLYTEFIHTQCPEYSQGEKYESFNTRIEKRMQELVRTQDTQPSAVRQKERKTNPERYQKAVQSLTEAFTLGAIPFIHVFFKDNEETDIYSFYLNQHRVSLMEEEDCKNDPYGDSFFDIW